MKSWSRPGNQLLWNISLGHEKSRARILYMYQFIKNEFKQKNLSVLGVFFAIQAMLCFNLVLIYLACLLWVVLHVLYMYSHAILCFNLLLMYWACLLWVVLLHMWYKAMLCSNKVLMYLACLLWVMLLHMCSNAMLYFDLVLIYWDCLSFFVLFVCPISYYCVLFMIHILHIYWQILIQLF